MAQSGGTSLKKDWRVWAQVAAAVLCGLGAVFSLVGREYWYSLYLAFAAMMFAVVAFDVVAFLGGRGPSRARTALV